MWLLFYFLSGLFLHYIHKVFYTFCRVSRSQRSFWQITGFIWYELFWYTPSIAFPFFFGLVVCVSFLLRLAYGTQKLHACDIDCHQALYIFAICISIFEFVGTIWYAYLWPTQRFVLVLEIGWRFDFGYWEFSPHWLWCDFEVLYCLHSSWTAFVWNMFWMGVLTGFSINLNPNIPRCLDQL